MKDYPRWDPISFKWGMIIVATHLLISSELSTFSFFHVLVVSYIFGALFAHQLFLLNHECSHGLCFPTIQSNHLFSLFLNIPLLLPYAVFFKKYHIDHHAYLGDSSKDMDVPSKWEAKVFRGRVGKLIWLSIQILVYALRPCIVKPQALTKKHVDNIVIQIVFITFWSATHSIMSFLYLILSIVFAGGLHPLASHFISEHFDLLNNGDDISSYYGCLNSMSFNVGYHKAHHDHPHVPWRYLPDIVDKNPQEYPQNKSVEWIGLQWKFVNDPNISLEKRRLTNDVHQQRSKYLDAANKPTPNLVYDAFLN